MRSLQVPRTCGALALTVALATAPDMLGQTPKRIPPPTEDVTAFTAGKKVAVVVGVSAYPELSGITRLQYAATDARGVETAVRAQGFVVVALTDTDAVRGSVKAALRRAADMVNGEDGTLLFFFSGHGFAEGPNSYLATYDTNASELSQTGLPFDEVRRILQSSRAKRKILLIDACRNESSSTKGLSGRTFSDFERAEGLKILFSTKLGSFSYEDPTLRAGVFTYFVLQGLNGKAAGPDGYITFDDLKRYVQTSVTDYAFERKWSQSPFEAGESAGEFLLATTSRPLVSTAPEPPPGSPLPKAPEAGMESLSTAQLLASPAWHAPSQRDVVATELRRRLRGGERPAIGTSGVRPECDPAVPLLAKKVMQEFGIDCGKATGDGK